MILLSPPSRTCVYMFQVWLYMKRTIALHVLYIATKATVRAIILGQLFMVSPKLMDLEGHLKHCLRKIFSEKVCRHLVHFY